MYVITNISEEYVASIFAAMKIPSVTDLQIPLRFKIKLTQLCNAVNMQ
jgi:hypothetical protein